ncbi:MAG: tRNA adenosine(34) deaminase TadA [Lachnospiraceae bacterium]|nr:tRNA adenosine(34) deaminase TadA [Lachnospiraceae bacterium]
MLTEDERFMKKALDQAKRAFDRKETPVGCVIVKDGKIIARAYNRRNEKKNTLAHAEMIAIDKASRKTGDWRLEGCTMYVTLEPCPMCGGAVIQSRIDRLVIGAMSEKNGCAGSVTDLMHIPGFNHHVETVTGVMQEKCSELLSLFFKRVRAENALRKSGNIDITE